jgi:hypothetical protein
MEYRPNSDPDSQFRVCRAIKNSFSLDSRMSITCKKVITVSASAPYRELTIGWVKTFAKMCWALLMQFSGYVGVIYYESPTIYILKRFWCLV